MRLALLLCDAQPINRADLARKAARGRSFQTFPAHDCLRWKKPVMMHVRGGLYKGRWEMLNSGALSAAPHNRVDADAAEIAPMKRQKTRRGLDGYLEKLKQSRGWPAVTTWNDSFERHRSRSSRRCPAPAGAGNTMKHVASEFPALGGDAQLEPRWASHLSDRQT